MSSKWGACSVSEHHFADLWITPVAEHALVGASDFFNLFSSLKYFYDNSLIHHCMSDKQAPQTPLSSASSVSTPRSNPRRARCPVRPRELRIWPGPLGARWAWSPKGMRKRTGAQNRARQHSYVGARSFRLWPTRGLFFSLCPGGWVPVPAPI